MALHFTKMIYQTDQMQSIINEICLNDEKTRIKNKLALPHGFSKWPRWFVKSVGSGFPHGIQRIRGNIMAEFVMYTAVSRLAKSFGSDLHGAMGVFSSDYSRANGNQIAATILSRTPALHGEGSHHDNLLRKIEVMYKRDIINITDLSNDVRNAEGDFSGSPEERINWFESIQNKVSPLSGVLNQDIMSSDGLKIDSKQKYLSLNIGRLNELRESSENIFICLEVWAKTANVMVRNSLAYANNPNAVDELDKTLANLVLELEKGRQQGYLSVKDDALEASSIVIRQAMKDLYVPLIDYCFPKADDVIEKISGKLKTQLNENIGKRLSDDVKRPYDLRTVVAETINGDRFEYFLLGLDAYNAYEKFSTSEELSNVGELFEVEGGFDVHDLKDKFVRAKDDIEAVANLFFELLVWDL
jgi:hypothetical protein